MIHESEQQAEPHDQRQAQTRPPQRGLSRGLHPLGHDGDEDDVVDAEDDLQRGEAGEADQTLGGEECTEVHGRAQS
jgi:hypothetical protein